MEWWELTPAKPKKHDKLKAHLQDSRNAALVVRIILHISQLLTDSERLR